MNEFPKSLLSDQTKIGLQATVLHETSDKSAVFLTLDNGILTLSKDGTWSWAARWVGQKSIKGDLRNDRQ